MVTLTPKRAEPPKSLRRSEQAFKKGGTASPSKRAAAGSGSLRRQVLVKSAEENKQSSHLIAASKVARDNGKTVKTGWGVFIANEGPRIKQKMPPGVTPSEYAKSLGVAWRALGANGQERYNAMARHINSKKNR